ncbi:DUF2127 domain-containing protein [Arthrobacter psychrolactophilus]
MDGIPEPVGGVLLLLVSPAQLGSLVQLLTRHELCDDRNDLISRYTGHLIGKQTVSAIVFGAIYLLLHGLVKITLVWAVLKDKLWAHPWVIIFLLTVFDIFIVGLTWHEYRAHQARTSAATHDADAAPSERSLPNS